MIIEKAIDRGLEVGDGSEDAALQSALCEGAKKPSTALTQEAEVGVKWKVQMAGDPLLHGGMLVGCEVVEDGVDGLADGDFSFDRVEETDELLMAMALHQNLTSGT